MANQIYATPELRHKLAILAAKEGRKIVDEVNFLVSARLVALGIDHRRHKSKWKEKK
tara:strand:+ start:121 stop:291 length:171 start_codon:yes stop_codon:yes gene_type:complete